MFIIIIGVLSILFGIIGLFMEIEAYAQQGSVDLLGIVLVFLFIVVGLLFCSWRRLISYIRQVASSHRSLLIVAGVIELIIAMPILVFFFMLGFHAFLAGELAIMVGFLSFALLISILLYVSLKALMVYGLVKQKKWSTFLALVFGIWYLFAGVFSIFSIPVLSLFLLSYAGFTLWAGLKCLKYSDYNS